MRKYLATLQVNALQQLAYWSEFAARGLFMLLFVGVFIALWTTAYRTSGRDELAGFTLTQMIWYLAMTETVVLAGSRVWNEISQHVKAGELAYFLSKPYSYPIFQLAHTLGDTGLRFLMNLVVGWALVWPVTGQFGGSLPGLAAFLLLGGLALLLDASIAVLIGLLAFFFEEVTPFYWIYQKLLFTVGGLFLPLDVFPGWLQTFSNLLPFRYIVYAPARSFVHFDLGFAGQTLLGQIAYLALTWGLIALVWRHGSRRVVINGG